MDEQKEQIIEVLSNEKKRKFVSQFIRKNGELFFCNDIRNNIS